MTQSVIILAILFQSIPKTNGPMVFKHDDEIEVARRITDLGSDSELAKQTLMNADLRLVVSIAKQYSYRGLPLSDLVQR